VLLGVDVEARDEDAVDALEPVAIRSALRAAPHRFPRDPILPRREDQRDVESDACRREILESVEASGRRGDLDHPVPMSRGPLASQLHVALDALAVRGRQLRVLEQGIELEAHVPVVAPRSVMNRHEHFLRGSHEPVRELPGDRLVVLALARKLPEASVADPALDDVGDDDGIRRGAGGA
jgi:hypothetical protein